MKKQYLVPVATIVATELFTNVLSGSHDIQEGWAEAKRNDNLWFDDEELEEEDLEYDDSDYDTGSTFWPVTYQR